MDSGESVELSCKKLKHRNRSNSIYEQTGVVVNVLLLSLIIWYWAGVSNAGESVCGNSDNVRFVDEV